MSIRQRLFALLLILAGSASLVIPARLLAQSEEPVEPISATPLPDSASSAIPQVHTVQEGENLTSIAIDYGVTVEEILAINNLTDGDFLQVGQELIIPGGAGESVATTYTIMPGDTLAGIASIFNTTLTDVVASNRLIYARPPLLSGQTVSIVSRTGTSAPQQVMGQPYIVQPGDTLLLVAARHKMTPGTLAEANGLAMHSHIFPGQRLRIPNAPSAYRDLPGSWADVRVSQPTIPQGGTLSIYARNLLPGTPAGRFGGIPLHFAPYNDGFVAFVGIDAFTEPGAYDLELSGGDERGLWQPLRAIIPVTDGGFDTQYIEVGDELSGLLDPAVRAADDAFMKSVYDAFKAEKLWDGLFQVPLTTTIISADYGGRRSYNGGPIDIYHTGIDYASPLGTDVMAPAAGIVAFTGSSELRGNVVVIDHGLGVMTGYYHLSEILVAVGQAVTPGERIGRVGSTGLSSGPHLHWDLRVMNVPVNPAMWTQELFPRIASVAAQAGP